MHQKENSNQLNNLYLNIDFGGGFMTGPHLPRVFVKVLIASFILASGSFIYQRSTEGNDGTGLDKITWSGRVRIELQSHYKHTPDKVYPPETITGDGYNDLVTITEYQIERLPHDQGLSWRSSDVRVQVRGNRSEHYDWTKKGGVETENRKLDELLEGSGNTTGSVSLYLRGPGDNDRGQCRIEVGAVGQRDDNGPVTQGIEFHGYKKIKYTQTGSSGDIQAATDSNESTAEKVFPLDAQIDIPCETDARSLHGDTMLDQSETVTRRISYDLYQDGDARTEVEMIPPDKYDQWEPQAGDNEKSLGNYIDVGIVAHTKGDPESKPPQKILKYKIQLEGTSKEQGIDLNWPQNASQNADFDMKIDKDNPWIKLTDNDAQSAETKEENLLQFSVTINSHDWGGWTKLRVTAELEDHSIVVAHVRGHADQESLALPKDDNSNHIADWWEHWFSIKNANEDADEDDTPRGDGDNGDSIALYDEYRGLHIQGKHQRLSPEYKELFIWDQHGLGTGIFPKVTGISVYLIQRNECVVRDMKYIVSPNGKHQPVYAIWLHKGPIGDGGLGDTDGGPGVPAKIYGVTIDSALIIKGYKKYAAAGLQSTIGHELGHTANIWHHGDDKDYLVGDVICRQPDNSVINYLCSGKASGGPRQAGDSCYEVAAKGGMYSGNDTCMMRYDKSHFYENEAGNCEWKFGGKTIYGKKYEQDPPGMSLCESPRGTGVNDASNPDNKAGDASPGRGECLYKFCINNRKH
jgi:hypothetical protein